MNQPTSNCSSIIDVPTITPPCHVSLTSRTSHSESLTCLSKIPGMGIAMAFISGIFFATAGFTVELMDGVDGSFVVATRSVIQLIFFLPIFIICNKRQDTKGIVDHQDDHHHHHHQQGRLSLLLTFGLRGERISLLGRCVFGFICFSLSYYALSFISLSDSSAIAFSAPVFVSIFACVLLKEPCGFFQVTTIGITILGVILISRPTVIFPPDDQVDQKDFSPTSRMVGVILSFITSLSMAYTFIALRKLQRTPTSLVITQFSIFCILCGFVTNAILYYGNLYSVVYPTTWNQWLWIVVNGLCGVGGQASLVLSLKLEEAGLVSLLRTFDVVMAFIYQIVFLDQPIYWTSIVGAVIICSGCVTVSVKKLVDSRKKSSKQLSN